MQVEKKNWTAFQQQNCFNSANTVTSNKKIEKYFNNFIQNIKQYKEQIIIYIYSENLNFYAFLLVFGFFFFSEIAIKVFLMLKNILIFLTLWSSSKHFSNKIFFAVKIRTEKKNWRFDKEEILQ